jgi:hypothetical protein
MKLVYLVHMEGTDYYKIGITSSTCSQRISTMQVGNPIRLYERHYIFASDKDAKVTERFLHDLYRKNWVRGEWFTFPCDEIISVIDKMDTQENQRYKRRAVPESYWAYHIKS